MVEHRDQLHEALRWLTEQGCVIKKVDRRGGSLQHVFVRLMREGILSVKAAGR